MGKIDRSVEINIGGEKRRLKFTIAALEELEARLPGRSIFELIASGTFSVTTLVDAIHTGLKHEDRKLVRDTVRGWVMEYLRDNDMGDLINIVYGAIGLSGIAGKDVSVFEDMISKTSKKDADEGDTGK